MTAKWCNDGVVDVERNVFFFTAHDTSSTTTTNNNNYNNKNNNKNNNTEEEETRLKSLFSMPACGVVDDMVKACRLLPSAVLPLSASSSPPLLLHPYHHDDHRSRSTPPPVRCLRNAAVAGASTRRAQSAERTGFAAPQEDEKEEEEEVRRRRRESLVWCCRPRQAYGLRDALEDEAMQWWNHAAAAAAAAADAVPDQITLAPRRSDEQARSSAGASPNNNNSSTTEHCGIREVMVKSDQCGGDGLCSRKRPREDGKAQDGDQQTHPISTTNTTAATTSYEVVEIHSDTSSPRGSQEEETQDMVPQTASKAIKKEISIQGVMGRPEEEGVQAKKKLTAHKNNKKTGSRQTSILSFLTREA